MFKIRRRGAETKAIQLYLEMMLKIIKHTPDIKEESIDGLLMQIALLERFKEDIGNTVTNLKSTFSRLMEHEIER